MACKFNKYFEVASNNHTGQSLAFVVAEIAFQVPVVVVTSSVAKITFLVDKTTFKMAVITFFSGQYHFCRGCDNF